MNNLDYINTRLEELKKVIKELPFEKDDLRKAYFELNWDILNNYYREFCWIFLTRLANMGKVIFDSEATKGFEHHIDRLTETTRHHVLFDSARNNANRSLLIDSWSNFEFCITYICNNILPEDVKIELLQEQSNQIKKIVKKHELSEFEENKIEKIFTKKHLTHVSINRKCDKLFKLINEDYQGVEKEDKKFLSFFGRYRNCLHTNFFFHGKNFTYTFKGVEFNFIDGKPILHNIEFDITNYFNLVLELNKIFSRIFVSIKHEEIIPYPSEEK